MAQATPGFCSPLLLPTHGNLTQTCIARDEFKKLPFELQQDYAIHYELPDAGCLTSEDICQLLCTRNEWIPVLVRSDHIHFPTPKGLIIARNVMEVVDRLVEERTDECGDFHDAEISQNSCNKQQSQPLTYPPVSFDYAPTPQPQVINHIEGLNQGNTDWLCIVSNDLERTNKLLKARILKTRRFAREVSADVLEFEVKMATEVSYHASVTAIMTKFCGKTAARVIKERISNSTKGGYLPERHLVNRSHQSQNGVNDAGRGDEHTNDTLRSTAITGAAHISLSEAPNPAHEPASPFEGHEISRNSTNDQVYRPARKRSRAEDEENFDEATTDLHLTESSHRSSNSLHRTKRMRPDIPEDNGLSVTEEMQDSASPMSNAGGIDQKQGMLQRTFRPLSMVTKILGNLRLRLSRDLSFILYLKDILAASFSSTSPSGPMDRNETYTASSFNAENYRMYILKRPYEPDDLNIDNDATSTSSEVDSTAYIRWNEYAIDTDISDDSSYCPFGRADIDIVDDEAALRRRNKRVLRSQYIRPSESSDSSIRIEYSEVEDWMHWKDYPSDDSSGSDESYSPPLWSLEDILEITADPAETPYSHDLYDSMDYVSGIANDVNAFRSWSPSGLSTGDSEEDHLAISTLPIPWRYYSRNPDLDRVVSSDKSEEGTIVRPPLRPESARDMRFAHWRRILRCLDGHEQFPALAQQWANVDVGANINLMFASDHFEYQFNGDLEWKAFELSDK